jgi:hypothetical protein
MPINLRDSGASATRDQAGHWQLHVGIYLPGITFWDGYRVQVRVIHEQDQFVRGIEPKVFHLSWHDNSDLSLWDATIDLIADSDGHFGQDGTYLYRFQLLHHNRVVTYWFSDPFARATGRGNVSAFTVDSSAADYSWHDGAFVVPEVDELVVYEVHVGEFNSSFDGLLLHATTSSQSASTGSTSSMLTVSATTTCREFSMGPPAADTPTWFTARTCTAGRQALIHGSRQTAAGAGSSSAQNTCRTPAASCAPPTPTPHGRTGCSGRQTGRRTGPSRFHSRTSLTLN